ncbi:MAG: Transcriptional regulator, TraR/DksA family [Parcubacteria group bacterium GW2011_GWC2_45_7]|uniref:Transcriptional regulator, TraR/DksA family n=1 Tax=Candidatus Magasanikbacteria bacterium GW2011_GWA2_50_22 TaxID=1619043 RepID=A0A0G1YRB7_9BACT|nr:MAG: Transcriptional regulator, TraR/DksA family [Parcubacteria group bacterium GW2011_GWC2_45_7]KKW17542.1 MAG: Transcriptional regulator, TraR/DksA family [Candidatus Magasanikbacteria bacterium GW2011_GWA2_50_22]
MDSSQIATIEKVLLEEKIKLESQLAQFTSKNIHNPEDYNAAFPQFGEKEEDNAVEVAQYSDNLTLERTLESALRDVNSALQRIKKGAYGICKYCKKPIDARRLVARPTSSSCIDCKKQLTQEV